MPEDRDPEVASEPAEETVHGEVPEGLGPDIFRAQLERAAQSPDEAQFTLQDEDVFLGDIESVEAEDEHRSRVRLRNGVIIGGLTGAAIVAALATVRYRRRHR